MFRAFFGDVISGRLARLPFIGYWILLWVLFPLFGLGIAFGIGLAEPLFFEGLETGRAYLLANFAPAVLVALGLFGLFFVFAQFNLLAKRIRDMGLPGWSVLLLIALIGVGLGYVLPPGGDLMRLENRVQGAFDTVWVLALLLIPGGLFARRAPLPSPAGSPAAPPAATRDGSAAVPTADPEPVEVPTAVGEPTAAASGHPGAPS